MPSVAYRPGCCLPSSSSKMGLSFLFKRRCRIKSDQYKNRQRGIAYEDCIAAFHSLFLLQFAASCPGVRWG